MLASARDGDRLQLTFLKDETFIPLFIQLLEKLSVNWGVFQEQDEETSKLVISSIDEFEDELFHYANEQMKLDLFVGSKKIIFVLISSETFQQKFLDEINACSDWK